MSAHATPTRSSDEASSLGHTPDGRWVFDDGVTRVFDDMLRRSIPQYEVMRTCVLDVGSRFVEPGTDIVDIGCSRGEALAGFLERFGEQNHYIGVDASPHMVAASQARFEREIADARVRISELDLRESYPEADASLTLCILTLQFTPIEYRQRILRDIFDSTRRGGALVIVEKILGSTADMDRLMVDIYYEGKEAAGYTASEIQRKRLALEGVLVPMKRGPPRLDRLS